MSPSLSVAVLDDELEVRDALATVLLREGFHAVLLDDTRDLLARAKAGSLPAVLLADLDLGGESVAKVLPRVLAAAPSLAVVAVTGHASDDWLFPAIEAGCVGYVLKSDAFVRLGDVVREVLGGGSPMTREISRRVLSRMRPDAASGPRPSEREIEVLELLADGYSYEQVALHLGVSIGTVRTHVKRLYGKLGVSTKSEATLRAMRLGLID
jgi:DNA-binding NarL/FixJ family response regulator